MLETMGEYAIGIFILVCVVGFFLDMFSGGGGQNYDGHDDGDF